jgi:hypothetical protein
MPWNEDHTAFVPANTEGPCGPPPTWEDIHPGRPRPHDHIPADDRIANALERIADALERKIEEEIKAKTPINPIVIQFDPKNIGLLKEELGVFGLEIPLK